MIKVSDYPDLTQKIEEFGLTTPKQLAILPINLESAKSRKDLVNSVTTSTVRVLWKKAGIIETPIDDTKTMPEYDQQSFEWVGPTIFFASTLMATNPELVDLAITVISNYLNEWFVGILKEERKVKLHVVKQTKTGSYKDIHYDGDVEGLKELPRIIRSLGDEQ